MSLVFKNILVPSNQPQTHALVIGVGAYRHLPGGSLYNEQPARFTMGLDQLTSPPLSAKAIADWLLTKHRNLEAPLGSVELLLSPEEFYVTQNGLTLSIEAATFTNIEAAFDRWVDRCDRSKQNVAFFYFCGHGLDYTTMTLLPDDFGASHTRPWANAIDFNQTYYGMNDCQAEVQCFFLDTCREVPKESLQTNGFDPRALKTSQLTSLPPRAAPIIKSSLQGGKAYAPVGQVSYFTRELIRTLNDFGADRKQGTLWVVTPESLSVGLSTALGWQDRHCSTEGEIQLSKRVIHQIPDPVKCMVRVTCSPPEQHQAARFIMTKQLVNPPTIYRRNPSAEPWKEEVESGVYRVEAQFTPGAFTNMEIPDFMVYPPEQVCPLP